MPFPNTRSNRQRGRSFGQRSNQLRHRGGRGRGPAKSTVNPARFINQATAPAAERIYKPIRQFKNFAFDPRMHQAIVAKGYSEPTAIQDQAIPHILAGKDVIGVANTGTGKTASFVLPIINRLIHHRHGMALVVTPTRELASQIDQEFRGFAKNLDLRSAVCVGGLREGPQIRALKTKPHLVVGTPGRLKDFINQRHLSLSQCLIFVLDEADRMLDMGFIHDMKFLMQHLPPERQSLCFSATITREVERIVQTLLNEPVTISVRSNLNNEHIEQSIIRADSPEDKLDHLKRFLGRPDWNRVLIFGQTKHGVQRLSDKLSKNGISSGAIHGNKNQNQRQRALAAFKSGDLQVLVATDVAARGIDVDDVSHVINYDPPQSYDDYIHRIGRTGRAGNVGTAVTFVSP